MALTVGLFLPLVALAAPPTVSISTPSGGASWGPAQNLKVMATAADTDGNIGRVEFYIDGSLAGTSYSPSSGTFNKFVAYLSNRPPAGDHTLLARAYDNSGESTDSAPYSLAVTPLPPPPVMAIESIDVTSVAASVNCVFTPNDYVITNGDVFIEFGLSTSYGGRTSNRIQVINAGDTGVLPRRLRLGFGSLDRGTTYHCRMAIKTWAGTFYGEDTTFTTALNLSPVAENVCGSTDGTQPAFIYPYFSDPDGEPAAITSIGVPSHGSVSLDVNGVLVYTPDHTFQTEDTFTYTVTDEYGASTTAQVRVTNFRKTGIGHYVLTVVDEGEDRAVGSVAINVTASGTFTGVMTYFGARYPVRARFSTDGGATAEIDRNGASSLRLFLGQSLAPLGVQVAGFLEVEGKEYALSPGYALIYPNNAPESGSYTMALPPSDPAMALGNGYVVGRVSNRGRVVFSGKIGDGQAFSFGTQLRTGGTAEIYVTAGTAPRDRIYGTIQFPGAGQNESTGALRWYKAPRTSGVFEGGFDTDVDVVGSRLQLAPGENEILNYSTELAGLEIQFSDLEGDIILDGSLSGLSEKSLTFAEGASASSLAERTARSRTPKVKPAVTFKVNPRNGSFTGSLRNPTENGTVRKFSGVLLQHQNKGAGLLKFTSGAGTVTLTAK